MVQIRIMFLCFMGLLSVSVCSQADFTVEAEPGDNVTLWCRHSLTKPEHIFWYKQTNNSAPIILGCKQFMLSVPAKKCYFITESERMVMGVNSVNSSLTIIAVNGSNSGLYYCSFMQSDHMIFSTATYLQIKVRNETLSKNPEEAADGAHCDVFFKLTLAFGALIGILLSVLIFIILKNQKRKRETSSQTQETQKQDKDLNYAALHFSKNKRKERGVDVSIDPHIVYSSIRQ